MGFPRQEYMPQSAMAQLNYLAPSHPATHHLPHIIPPCNMPSHLSLYLCTHTPPQLPSTHTTYAYSHYSIPFLTTATSSQSIQWHDYPPSHNMPDQASAHLTQRCTGMGSHSLLQRIFLTQGLNPGIPQCKADSLPSEPPGKPFIIQTSSKFNMGL